MRAYLVPVASCMCAAAAAAAAAHKAARRLCTALFSLKALSAIGTLISSFAIALLRVWSVLQVSVGRVGSDFTCCGRSCAQELSSIALSVFGGGFFPQLKGCSLSFVYIMDLARMGRFACIILNLLSQFGVREIYRETSSRETWPD